MTRLVKKRATTLSIKDTQKLLDEIKESERADQFFFDQGRDQRRKLAGLHFDRRVSRKTKFNRRLEAQIAVNLVHSHIRSLLPTVFFREPTVTARPLNQFQAGKEETWELVLNNTLKRNGYKVETKACVLDALTYHEGWKKLGYNLPEEPGQDQEEGGDQGSKETVQTNRGPTPWGSKEIPISMRVSPMNVIVDYLAPGRDPRHARFVAVKYIRPLEELKADDRYKNVDSISREAIVSSRDKAVMRRMDETSTTGNEFTTRAKGGPGVDMVVFYECYVYQMVDMKLYRQTVWVAEGSDKPIRMESWEQLFGIKFPGWPIHRMVFNPVPDDYPMSEIEVWQQLQESLNWVVSKLVTFVSQGNQRVLFDPTKIVKPKNFRSKWLNGQAVEAIEVKDVGSIREAVDVVQGTPVPQDVYRLIDVLVTFIERTSLLGQNAQQQGGVFRTATEADAVSQAGRVRESERVDLVRDFLRDDVRKIAAIIRSNADTEMVVRLAGDTGRVRWERFQPEDIEWEPDINIEVDSFRELPQQQELATWIQVFNVAQGLFPIMPNVIRMDIIFMKLMKAAGVPNPEEIAGNLAGQRERQMFEIMVMMMGEQIDAQPDEPHGEHIASIELFMNSDVWRLVQGTEAEQLILAHLAQHEEFLQALREQADQNGNGSVGQNAGDQLLGNDRRREAGLRREATRTGGRDQENFV